MQTRRESDSIGEIEVPADHYWGAQAERSLHHFDIGQPQFRWHPAVIHALGSIKAAAAEANRDLGRLDLQPDAVGHLITAAREVRDGQWDGEFPLVVFQTGSGTQTNMNANEVIAARANELAGAGRGGKSPVHPNDDVNRGQSSNDVIPTAVNVAVVGQLRARLYPAAEAASGTLRSKASELDGIVKSGRTHLQDATPVRLSQEVGAWASMLDAAVLALRASEDGVCQLAIGGTAVGTGVNTHPEFGARVCAVLAKESGAPFRQADDLFAAMSAHDALALTSAALRGLALVLYKIAGDVRLLASGPSTAIGEIRIPANEPGSSIMPGKVNPTQAEAVQMVAARVIGNDATVTFAAAQNALQLDVMRPVVGHAVLESIDLLADACTSFDRWCLQGLEANTDRIRAHLERNVMLVTALAPHIGYDEAAAVAKEAMVSGRTLREVAHERAGVSDEDFDAWVDPEAMTRPAAP